MNKELLISIIVTSLVVIGCSEKNVVSDKTVKELSKSDDIYAYVITKSINDCQEYNITLNEKRINDFIHQSPKSTIEKASKEEGKTPKKLCQFFAEEISDKKIEKVNIFTSKIINSCEKLGVTLFKDAIHRKIQNLPLFIIEKGLAMGDETSVKECALMKKKYQ